MRFLLEESFDDVTELNKEVLLEKVESMFSDTQIDFEMIEAISNQHAYFRINVSNPMRYGSDMYYGYACHFGNTLVVSLSELSTFEVLSNSYERFKISDREKLVVL